MQGGGRNAAGAPAFLMLLLILAAGTPSPCARGVAARSSVHLPAPVSGDEAAAEHSWCSNDRSNGGSGPCLPPN